MPDRPRFQSPRTQRLSVTVAMAVVFAGAMGLAYLTAAMAAPAPPRQVTINGVRVLLPGDWIETPDRTPVSDLDPTMVLGDPEREWRWLLVAATATAERVPPHEMMTRYLAAVLEPAHKRTLEPLAGRGPQTRGPMTVMRYVGLSQPEAAPGQQLHLVTTITLDDRQHWLIYLTDRVAPGESFVNVLRRNMALLGRIEQTVRPDGLDDEERPS